MQIPKHDLFSFSHLMGKTLVSAICIAGCQQKAQFLDAASIIFIPKMYILGGGERGGRRKGRRAMVMTLYTCPWHLLIVCPHDLNLKAQYTKITVLKLNV